MRLYLALGFAVFLTLVSGATAVFYFEQSGDLNYELESVSVPALEASWEAAREAERLRVLALGLMAEPESGVQDFQTESVTDSLDRMRSALNVVGGVPSLGPDVQSVNDSANELAEVIDNLTANRDSFWPQTTQPQTFSRARQTYRPMLVSHERPWQCCNGPGWRVMRLNFKCFGPSSTLYSL